MVLFHCGSIRFYIVEKQKEWVCKPSSVPPCLLSKTETGAAAICLDQLLPVGSPDISGSDLPAGRTRLWRTYTRVRYGGILSPVFYTGSAGRLLGLAGGGVCPAGDVAAAAVRSYRPATSALAKSCGRLRRILRSSAGAKEDTISPLPVPRKIGTIGCVFSVALSLRLPPVAVSHHRALSCSDFPPHTCFAKQSKWGRPPDPLFLIDYLLLAIDYYIA